MSRALQTLARLRRVQTLQARRAMTQATAAEHAAAEAVLAAEQAVLAEAKAGGALPGAFGAWLPQGFRGVVQARADAAIAAAERERARAAYGTCRQAEDAVAELIEERAEASRKAAERQAEQAAADGARSARSTSDEASADSF